MPLASILRAFLHFRRTPASDSLFGRDWCGVVCEMRFAGGRRFLTNETRELSLQDITWFSGEVIFTAGRVLRFFLGIGRYRLFSGLTWVVLSAVHA